MLLNNTGPHERGDANPQKIEYTDHISFRSAIWSTEYFTSEKFHDFIHFSLLQKSSPEPARKERTMTSKYSELPHLVPLPALRGRRGLMEKEYSDHSPAPHFGSLGDRLPGGGDSCGWEREGISIYNCVCFFCFFVQNRFTCVVYLFEICLTCLY